MSEAPNLAIPDEPLAVSVLTGFLGSGKTTLLRHLLAHPAMEETAVIVNEFGEIGLDHLLVERATEDTVLLNSGCLCCTVRGDLVAGMRDLFKRRVKGEVPPFRRLVIETTGLADPAPILQTLMTDPLLSQRFRLDGVIATVDAAIGAATLDRQIESVKQAAVADRILLTKSDLTDAESRTALEARLRALNPAAPIYPVVQGEIEPALLFNAGLYDPTTKTADVQAWLKAEAYDHDGHEHGHHHHHDVNRHDESIRAFCLTYDKPLDWDRFNSWVEMLITLHGGGILRIKGILNVAGVEQPIAIHGVQHVFHPPVRLEAWPDGDRRSRIVFIVRDLKPEMFEHTLKAFNEDSSAPVA
ncbi:MAG: CobW family GTP-binding protein [Kiloniellaceae bacterium]